MNLMGILSEWQATAKDLSTADSILDEARTLYARYIINRARECGSVASLAGRCKMPVTTIHSALDRRGIKNLKSVSHEIERKGKWS